MSRRAAEDVLAASLRSMVLPRPRARGTKRDALPRSALRAGAKGWYLRPPGRNAAGKRHAELFLGTHRMLPTRAAAETEARAVLERRAITKLPPGAGVSFEAFADAYLHEHIASLRTSTARTQRSTLRRHLLPEFRRLALHEITRPLVQAWVWRMRDAGVPLTTARSRVALLRSMLYEAFHRGIACEPIKGIDWYADDSIGRTHDQVTFTRHEAQAVITCAPWPWRAAFAIALYMGDRVGEILGLTWSDIDLARARLYVRRQRQRGELVATKTRGSVAELAMPDELVDVLEAYRAQAPADAAFLFPSRRCDGPIGDDALRRALKRACTAAGVPYRHGMHAFRRCFAAQLSAAGATLPQISMALRHRQLQTTLKYLGPAQRADVDELIRTAAALAAPRART